MKTLITFVIAASAGWAQTPTQEIAASPETKTTFAMRVNLVMVPVVVRDSKGRAVGNLTKEDFQLFDKGKPQMISRFSEEHAGERAAGKDGGGKSDGKATGDDVIAMPTRFIAYVFDDMHLTVSNLTQARDAARKHLKEALPAGDRAAVYTTSGKVMLDFTSDHALLEATIRSILPRVSMMATKMDCPSISYYMAEKIQNNDPMALESARQDRLRCMPGLRDSGIPQSGADIQGTAFRVKAEADRDVQMTIATLNTIVGKMSVAPGQRLVVLLSPGYYLTEQYRTMESAVIDEAIRSNVAINAVDARGLYITPRQGDISTPGFSDIATSATRDRYAQESALAEGETLGDLAAGTGGTWFHNNNELGEGLKQMTAAPEAHYILGFSPQNLKLDGSFHSLKVTLKGREMTVQARRGYFAPKHVLDAAEQAEEDIRETFYSREEIGEIPVTIQSQFFKPAADAAKVSVVARVDLRQLRYRKAEGRNADMVTMVTGLFDLNGNLVNAFSKTFDLRFKDESLGTRAAAGISAKTNFDVPPGKYLIRLVVRDSEGQMMGAKNGSVDIP